MKRFFKGIFLTFLIIGIIFSVIISVFLLTPTKMELNTKSLETINDFTSFYDTHNSKMSTNLSNEKITYLDINNLTKNAFIASEDKNFYKHKGLDYLRMIKALFVNVKNGEISQGASTISQQLIKNTHLSSEKTLNRKLKEIKLTQKLEKTYSKDEILTFYLNTIYFGENCYGIQKASKHYFSKDAKDLDLNESATLSAIIKSPSKINPVKNPSLTKTRRNLVLKSMNELGYISKQEYEKTSSEEIPLNVSNNESYSSSYFKAVLNEIDEELNLSPNNLSGYKIYTYYDNSLQQTLKDAKTDQNFDYQAIIINNKDLSIPAYFSTCGEIERQPASTIKPIYVYAPAIDGKKITETTCFFDEKTSFDGYVPKNYNDKYYGVVTTKEALYKSLNVPTIKILNLCGINYCKKYLERLGIDLKNDELSSGLGVTSEGVKLKSLAGAYSTFANFGKFKKPTFIKKIVDNNGKTIYENDNKFTEVFQSGTCSIITNALKDTVAIGTAKRLNYHNYDIACKTGTSGNENGNTDAYAISYTTSNTVATWVGYQDMSYMDNSITGGNTPCASLNYIYDNIYNQQNLPKNFQIIGANYHSIDKISFENDYKTLLADPNSPQKYSFDALYLNGTEPKEQSTLFSNPQINEINLSLENNVLSFSVDKKDIIGIKIFIENNGVETQIYNGKDNNFAYDLTNFGEYKIYVQPYVTGKNGEILGKKTFFKQINYKNNASNTTNNSSSNNVPENWWLE